MVLTDDFKYNDMEGQLRFAEGEKKGMKKGRAEGREEGREEGRVEGEKKGRVEGEKKGRVEGMKKGRVEGLLEGALKKSAELVGNLMKNTGESIETVFKLLSIPDDQRPAVRKMLQL